MKQINDIIISFIIINIGYEKGEEVYGWLTWRYQVRVGET